uniref:non-specific serine/threonine protein kinase n=1 Tax=Syphacia muris TaxID=451379 RepID=A0A0N5AV36_9BILA
MRMEGVEEFQIFLEYVDGGELFDQIEPDVGMPSAKAQYYFLQLIDGVKHMHNLGIAHRDIKPENILISQKDVLKISDFGMATIFRHEGKERYLTTRCGTLPYVSPQVMAGCYRGEPSDIWSCGVVLVTMLAGELPWESPERLNTSYRHWVNNKSLCEQPWRKIGNFALGLLRIILCENEKSRATIERIQKHPWCNIDFKDPLQLLVKRMTRFCASVSVCEALDMIIGSVMIDFRRSRGDGIEFKRAFIELKKKLSSVICKQGITWLERKGFVYSQEVNKASA